MKWEGSLEDEDTWEPPKGMKNAGEEVERSERENPDMPSREDLE